MRDILIRNYGFISSSDEHICPVRRRATVFPSAEGILEVMNEEGESFDLDRLTVLFITAHKSLPMEELIEKASQRYRPLPVLPHNQTTYTIGALRRINVEGHFIPPGGPKVFPHLVQC